MNSLVQKWGDPPGSFEIMIYKDHSQWQKCFSGESNPVTTNETFLSSPHETPAYLRLSPVEDEVV